MLGGVSGSTVDSGGGRQYGVMEERGECVIKMELRHKDENME